MYCRIRNTPWFHLCYVRLGCGDTYPDVFSVPASSIIHCNDYTLKSTYWGCVHEPAQKGTCEEGFRRGCKGQRVRSRKPFDWHYAESVQKSVSRKKSASFSPRSVRCTSKSAWTPLKSLGSLTHISFGHLSWTDSSIPALASGPSLGVARGLTHLS